MQAEALFMQYATEGPARATTSVLQSGRVSHRSCATSLLYSTTPVPDDGLLRPISASRHSSHASHIVAVGMSMDLEMSSDLAGVYPREP